MSTSATGTLIDENGAPISNLRVLMRDESGLFASDLAFADSSSSGTFTVTYGADLTPDLGTRRFGIYVFTLSHRQVYHDTKDDPAAATLSLGNITIKRAEVSGFPVTLGGSAQALPVRDGNAVRVMIDDEDAWAHVKDAINGATSLISILQLQLDRPPAYNANPALESPEIVLSFDGAVDPLNPRKVNKPTDFRPERMLLDKQSHGVKVRVMMGKAVINWAILGIDILIMFIPLLLLVIFDVGRSWNMIALIFKSRPPGGLDDVKKYFDAAGSGVATAAFPTTLFNVVHAKLVMVDDTEAIVLGSPFSQSYWDTHDHHVFEPRRGSAAGEPVPVHDVSMSVRGPAVKDMHDAYRIHWNVANPADQIAAITPAAPITTAGTGESIASLQLIRSINGGAFATMPDGEKGVLEAYLRAIETAQTYIYFENQYFTNETIGKALIAALNDTARPNLQIMVMLNVTPDMPFYPTWQSNLIGRIRKDAKANASRVDFFTAWTHEAPVTGLSGANPMIMANYLHSKVGIVDGKWATVGSANLDGASLDAFEIIHPLQFADNRNHELNYIIFNDTAARQTDAVDIFRRNLWSEHLGMDAADPRLVSNASNDAGWLALWKATAEKKRTGLVNNPATIDKTNGRVLRYPESAVSGISILLPWVNPERDFLASSGIKFDKLDLIEQTRAFNFGTGAWK